MGRSLTHKILESHLTDGELKAGQEIGIRVDQALIQDITGTMVMLNFEAMGLPRIRTKVAVAYGDHNVIQVDQRNTEDHVYLASSANKYGIWWGKPSTGIGHQIHQEHFAVPGEVALGADSHTPHCGGLGMIAIGAGGLDIAVAMGGGPYFFTMPNVVNVQLSGELGPWCTAKDVIMELLRRITVRGGLGNIFEYTGPGTRALNAQQRCTITNMGAEVGLTTSIFPSDDITREFFELVGRGQDWTEALPDADAHYDDSIQLDLSEVEPLVALPSNPDKGVPISQVEGTKIQQVAIGSCTNGAYMDLKSAARIVKGHQVHPSIDFVIHPSSRKDLAELTREGLLTDLIDAGVNVAESTCGFCIGTGHVPAEGTRSLRAINRNFKGRSGLAEDEVYLCSSEVAAASAIAGVIADPRKLDIEPPSQDLPARFSQDNPGLVPPASEDEAADLTVVRGSNIQPVAVNPPVTGDIEGAVVIKVGDDISTDHIMPAGAHILPFRSNIPKLSDFAFGRIDPDFPDRARREGGGFIVGGSNYGQGSSREHAAIVPMYLGVKAVLAKSFARIHRANLINWGILPLQFSDPGDYDSTDQGDRLTIPNMHSLLGENAESLDVRNETKGKTIVTTITVTPRERAYLLAGGKLAYTKSHPSGA